MIELDQAVQHRGKRLLDVDGQEVGQIREIYVDDDTRAPRWVLVETEGVATRPHFVPLEGASSEGDDLKVAWSKEKIDGAPPIDLSDQHLDADEEQTLYAYYGQQRRGRQAAVGEPATEPVTEPAPAPVPEPEADTLASAPDAPADPPLRFEASVSTAGTPSDPVAARAVGGAGGKGPVAVPAAGAVGAAVLALLGLLLRRRRSARRAAALRAAQEAGRPLLWALLGLGVLRRIRRRRRRSSAAGRRGAVHHIEQQHTADGTLRARDVMTVDVECVAEIDTLEEVARTMARLDVGAVPVCGVDRRLKGMVTDRDLVVNAMAAGRDPARVAVGELLRGPVVSVAPDDDLDVAIDLMARHQLRRLPVVEGRHLVGMLSQADVARHVEEQRTGELVREVSQPT